jgi:outer membrane protein TolC
MRILFFLGLLSLVAWRTEAQTNTFTLEQCIDYALTHNPNVINARIEREISETTVKETLSQGLPQISANGGVSKNFIIPELPFTNPITGEETTIAFQRAWTGNALVNMDQMIFDGSYFVGLQAARTYRQLAEKDQIKTEIDLVEAVSKAYYSVLVAQERRTLAKANLSRIDSLLDETNKLYAAGFAEKIDISRVEVQRNLLLTQLDNLDQLEQVSYGLLKFQMGMPQQEELRTAIGLKDLKWEEEMIAANNFSYFDRIEYQQLHVNKALAELDLKNNHVKYIPRLDAFINYGGNMFADTRSDLFNLGRSWIPNSAVGLNIRVPIFDGFYKSALIQRNRLVIRQLENQFELLENNIDREIDEKRLQLTNSLKRVRSERKNMDLSMEVFEVTRTKYQEGVGSNLEVIEAENAYKQSETNYYVAVYDAIIAKIELEKALGILK